MDDLEQVVTDEGVMDKVGAAVEQVAPAKVFCPTDGPYYPADDPLPTELTQPGEGVVNVRPMRWSRVSLGEDDRGLFVEWGSGVEPCQVLERVDLEEGSDFVMITVYEGTTNPHAGCQAVGISRAAEVGLAEPIGDREVVDGAPPRS